MGEEAVKEESKQTHDHVELEQQQQPEPSCVDNLIVEMQKFVGVDKSNVNEGQDSSAPSVLEAAEIFGDGKGVSDVDSGVQCESEVCLKVENDTVVRNAESDVRSESEKTVKVKSDNIVNNVDSDVPRESAMGVKVESDKIISNVESDVQCESEVAVMIESDKVISNVDSDVQCESEVAVMIETDKVISNLGSDVQCEREVAVAVKSEKVVGDVDSNVHPESEVCLKSENDKVMSNTDSDVRSESEVAMKVENDKIVGNTDTNTHPETDVAVAVEGDSFVKNVDSAVDQESEVCLETPGEENGKKEEVVKDVQVSKAVELGVGAETGEPDSNAGQTAQASMEIDKEDNDGNEGKAPKDEVASKANEAHTDGVVGQVEPDTCGDIEIAKDGKKEEVVKDVQVSKAVELGVGAETGEPDSNAGQTAQASMEIDKEDNDGKEGKAPKDEVASKANEAHTDGVVGRVEPDTCSDIEIAKESLTDGVSSKANPSSKPLTNAEAHRVYSKLENTMPHDSKIAKEELVDAASRKAKRSHFPSGPPSVVKQLKANHVCKVERGMPQDSEVSMETESESDDDNEKGHALTGHLSSKTKFPQHHNTKEQLPDPKVLVERQVGIKSSDTERTFMLEPEEEGNESGTEEEQAAFMREVDKFHKEKHLEFKPPKFYKEELNLLKLWRAVIKLGGYEKVTAFKLWRQIGESFNPPKTCTTVSWTFRIFYEKALVEFEKYRWHGSELALPETSRAEIRADGSGSGRTLRDAAARAMQGWHSQRLTGNGEEKQLSTTPKMDKQLKSSGLLKRKKFSPGEYSAQVTHMRSTKPRLDMTVFDIGPPADWVKINVKRFSDCFEVYALVPGLLREEVHVQSDPIGRLIITGQPMQLDNPWGVTPFKKVVSLPSRIDPLQTSAVVTFNGQLFVRVPLEQSEY